MAKKGMKLEGQALTDFQNKTKETRAKNVESGKAVAARLGIDVEALSLEDLNALTTYFTEAKKTKKTTTKKARISKEDKAKRNEEKKAERNKLNDSIVNAFNSGKKVKVSFNTSGCCLEGVVEELIKKGKGYSASIKTRSAGTFSKVALGNIVGLKAA